MALKWVSTLLIPAVLATQQWGSWCPSVSSAQHDLGSQLSSRCSVASGSTAPQRWSDYEEPIGNIVVNVATENDVAVTVQYCNQRNLSFITQNGGNGWADTFHLGNCGVVINLAGLNQIAFSQDKTRATIQGGVGVQSMIEASFYNNTRFALPTCSCLGWLGSALGGGINRVSGTYGWLVDQVISLNVVTASGSLTTVSSTSNPDLFWALNGAGPNFGIVTSAVIKAYPMPMAQNAAWAGPLIFSEDKLEALVTAINNLNMQPEMEIDLLVANVGPPTFAPLIIAYPFYLGNTTAAQKAFAPIINLGPLQNNATQLSYLNWSDWTASFCQKGGSKPVYGASGNVVNPTSFRAAYNAYKNLLTTYGGDKFGNTSILVERYSTQRALQVGSSASSFPYRTLPVHTAIIPWFNDPSLAGVANAWGQQVRALLRTNDGISANSTYINFAHGDESLTDIYGSSLPRLESLKSQYDPQNRFNQWFPLVR